MFAAWTGAYRPNIAAQVRLPFQPSGNSLLKLVEENLHNPEIAASYLENLLASLNSHSFNFTAHTKIYEFLTILFSQILKKTNWLILVQALLDQTPHLAPLQQILACQFARYLKPNNDDLIAYVNTFHYYARAIAIDRQVDVIHQEASALFSQLFFQGSNFPDCVSRRYYESLTKLRQNAATPQQMFSGWKAFIKDELLRDCFNILGQPPCGYEICAMGAMAQQEPCPYFALEYFILIEDETHRPYFAALATILDIQIILLGETLPTEGLYFTALGSKNLSGFHISPLSNPAKDPDGLIKTPKQMAIKQTDQIGNLNCFEITGMSATSIATNNPDLFETYVRSMREILEVSENGISRRKELALQLLRKRLEAFKTMWSQPFSNQTPVIDLANHYTIFSSGLLSDLVLYFNISETSQFEIVRKLVDRGIITAASGILFSEILTSVHAIRSALHLKYGYHNDKGSFPGVSLDLISFNVSELESLEKGYWLVLSPLYTILRDILEGQEGKFEESFTNIDFIEMAFQIALGKAKKGKDIQATLFHIAQTEMNSERLIKYYRQLGTCPTHTDENRTLFLNVLSSVQSNHVATLVDIPNIYGMRRSYFQRQQGLRNAIATLSHVQTPQYDNRGITVKVLTTFGCEFYVDAAVIAELISDEGGIQKKVSNSSHNIGFLSTHGLHFKEKPANPFIEYGIHSLSYRIAGYLTPAIELVRFEVDVGGKTVIYPVLISESIVGAPLKDQGFEWSDCDQQQWTKMFLANILIRPGNGTPSKYKLVDKEGKLQIFCVNNEVSFVDPVTSRLLKKTINFCSALFCLFPNVVLSREVLREFLDIDAASILEHWLEEMIETEKVWISLFSEQERVQFFEQSNSCRIDCLIPEGSLAHLELQIVHLQRFISTLFQGQETLTVNKLLGELISLRQDNTTKLLTGPYVASTYQRAMSYPTLQERLKWIIGRDTTEPMTSVQSNLVVFGKNPTYNEVKGRKEYSPEEARQELCRTTTNETTIVVFGKVLGGRIRSRQVDATPGTSRQNAIIQSLSHLFYRGDVRPAALTIQRCHVLSSENISPFLHKQLEYLQLRSCSLVSDLDIQMIPRAISNLEELHLIDCARLTAIVSSFMFKAAPITFNRLKVLVVSDCPNLKTIWFAAPLLSRLLLQNNQGLETVDVEAIEARSQIEDCPHLQRFDAEIDDVAAWLESAPANWRNDKEIQLAVEKRGLFPLVQRNGMALEQASVGLKNNREFVQFAVEQNGLALQFADEKLKDDKGVAVTAILQNGLALQFASDNLKSYPQLVLDAVKQNGLALQYASKALRQEASVVLAAIRQNPAAIQFAAGSLKHDKGFILEAAKLLEETVLWASDKLQNDLSFLLEIIRVNGKSLLYVREDLKNDEVFVLEAIRNNAVAFQHAKEQFRSNEKFALKAVTANCEAFSYAGNILQCDEHFVFQALKLDDRVFLYVNEKLKSDVDFVLASVRANGMILQHVNEYMLTNSTIILAALQQNGMALKYAGAVWQATKEMVIAAVSQNGMALEYASAQRRDDPNVVMVAVSQCGLALAHVGPNRHLDDVVVLAAVNQNGLALQFAGEMSRANKEIVLVAVTNDGGALEFASPGLQDDRDVVLVAIKQYGWMIKFASLRLQKEIAANKAARH